MNTILQLIESYGGYAILGAILLLMLFSISYFIIYKKLLNGKRTITLRRFVILFLFIGYVCLILGATLASRGYYWGEIYRSYNLELFSSYREAWNEASLRMWRQIGLNIIMFIPVGFLLPFLHRKMKSAIKTIGISFLFSAGIEVIQYMFGLGVCELDDCFNNTLGAVLGYCIAMIVHIFLENGDKKGRNKPDGGWKKKVRYKWSNRLPKIMVFFSPILVTILVFHSLYLAYTFQEFGNLRNIHGNVNMSQAEIILETPLKEENEKSKEMIYRSKVYTVEEAKEFAKEFYKERGINADNMEVLVFEDDIQFYADQQYHYMLYFTRQGGTYYCFLSDEEEVSSREKNIIKGTSALEEEKKAKTALEAIGITVPKGMVWIEDEKEEGVYGWQAHMVEGDNYLLDGKLLLQYDKNGDVSKLEYKVISYLPYKEKEIISEQEACQKIKEGKWSYDGNVQTLRIIDITLDYEMDTKGFLQPVYQFTTKINQNQEPVVITVAAVK